MIMEDIKRHLYSEHKLHMLSFKELDIKFLKDHIEYKQHKKAECYQYTDEGLIEVKTTYIIKKIDEIHLSTLYIKVHGVIERYDNDVMTRKIKVLKIPRIRKNEELLIKRLKDYK